MSYFDGPNRIMSVMNVPVDDSNFGTPSSISFTKSWNLGSSSCSTVIAGVPKNSSAISISAWTPELDRLGSVWPSLTKPQAGLPPIAGQPFGDATALWIVFHDSWPLVSPVSTLARSSQTTNTSGDSSSG